MIRRKIGVGALLPALLALSGCAAWLDPDEVRICRTALPALEAGGTAIAIARVTHGSQQHSVLIGYRATGPGSAPVERVAQCRFAVGPAAGGHADLIGLHGSRGELSGAALYLLKRYYLDTPEGIASAPAGDDRAAALPPIPGPLAFAAQQILFALPHAAVYALLAAAYALVYGLVGRINLAFGEIAAVAAAALGLTVAGLGAAFDAAPPLALPVGFAAALLAGAVHAAVAGHATFARMRSAPPQASLIATVGAALALAEYLRLAQGTRPNWLPPLGGGAIGLARADGFTVSVTPAALFVTAIGMAGITLLILSLRRTGFGRAWRAYADDPLAAALFGIDGPRLIGRTLALAGAAAGLAAALLAIQFGALGYADGFALGLKALLASVLGGIGSVPAAAAGGLCIALFEGLWSAYWPIEGRDAALLAALVLVLVLRPGGLFATPDPPRPAA